MPRRPLALTGLLACLTAAFAAHASAQLPPWPAGPGTEIGKMGAPGGLPAGFEPSGVVFHPGRHSVVVVSDGGLVAELPPGGGPVTVHPLPGDLEGITLRDPASSLVYVGVEHPDGVVEFDLATGLATGNAWNLTAWMTGPVNEGLEALAFVDGEFWAGLQRDGTIFRFELLPGGVVQFLGSMPSHKARADLSALDWDPCTGVVYALHDAADVIVEYDAGGSFLREHALAGHNQEGVGLLGGSPHTEASLFVAQDTGQLLRYEGFPVSPCPPGAWTDLGGGTTGSAGAPTLSGSGPLQAGWAFGLALAAAPPHAPLLVAVSLQSSPVAALGGTFFPLPGASHFVLGADASGAFGAAAIWPAGVPPGLSVWFQVVVLDPGHTPALTLSNGLRATAP